MLVSFTRHLRRNFIAYAALLFALSGTSYAAATTLLPTNSVGTKQVINHSLLKRDFKPGQLPRGARGNAGPPGIATVGTADGTAAAMCGLGGGRCQVAASTATCPSGVVVGGGYASDSPDVVVPVAGRTAGNTYGVIAINYSKSSATITAQAICAVGPGASASATTTRARASFATMLERARQEVGR